MRCVIAVTEFQDAFYRGWSVYLCERGRKPKAAPEKSDTDGLSLDGICAGSMRWVGVIRGFEELSATANRDF